MEKSEDGLEGTVAALGLTGAFVFNQDWRAEAEFWLPRYLDDANGDPKHRDILLSFSAVRTFRAGKTRPFVLAGLSFSQTQDWFNFCTAERSLDPGAPPERILVSCGDPNVIERRRERNDGRDGYLLVGGGLEVPIGRRASIVADLRFCLAPASVLVRPGVGVAVRF